MEPPCLFVYVYKLYKGDKVRVMKKNEFKVILVVFLIMVLLLVLVILIKNGKNKTLKSESSNNQNENQEFVEIQQDGTKVNTSNKLKQDKTIDGLTITDISIKTKNNETILKATVKNPTNTVKGNYEVIIKIKDKDGNVIKQISGYINTTKAKEQSILSIKTSSDFANAYDFEIVKEK